MLQAMGSQTDLETEQQHEMRWLVRSHHSMDMNLSKLGGDSEGQESLAGYSP